MIADVEYRISEEHIIDVFVEIKIRKGFNDPVCIQCPDIASFNQRIGAINAFVRTTPFGLDIEHPAFSPVKIKEVVIKGKIQLPEKVVSRVHLDPTGIPIHQSLNG
jgi:hypothetical protein